MSRHVLVDVLYTRKVEIDIGIRRVRRDDEARGILMMSAEGGMASRTRLNNSEAEGR